MSCMGISCYGDGFRLPGPPSECSMRSKARIDALFEDSKSVCSSTLGGWYASVSTVNTHNPEDVGIDEQKRVNSAVQARIEAMFASVEAENGTPGEAAAAILPVKYMGAAPVGGRVASVRGLQEPLRQLLERMEDSVQAELEVSRRGLTFRTNEICEKNNPFRRIAVWSALRLRKKETADGDLHHAFLPLVGDQDQSQTAEDKHADLYRTMRGLRMDAEEYPPIFAVVMRRPGVTRVLECHAFACETEEDAVAAAATLYRALLADLDANRRRPRHANGVGCVSLASVASSLRDVSPNSRMSHRLNILAPPVAKPTPVHPVRPPRTKKTSASSSMTEEETKKSPEPQNIPRRKKKNSDASAEDILEARDRRRDNNVKEKLKSTSGVKKSETNLTKDEEWQNSKNRIYGNKIEESAPVKIEMERPASRLERIYDIRDPGSNEWQMNKYEKLPIETNNAKNVNSEKIYSHIRRKEIDSSKENIYDVKSSDSSKHSPIRHELCLGSQRSSMIYDKIEKPISKSEENSNYERSSRRSNNINKLYEEHFRDADKIYSLAQENIPSNKSNQSERSKMMNSQEDIYGNQRKKNDIYQVISQTDLNSTISSQQRRSSQDSGKMSTGRRLSRVVTMDKPLKKPGGDVESNIPEYSQPRVRKRSRAGSEPPVSHSDAAAKTLQENRLKRSQSDLDVDRGDLLTRVELPRRGSFLNSGSTRKPNTITGGTPLGFTELFDEFRNQEGLTSVDDILAAIIDPEGMSFNDLKPLYKEFLLKLAATLTQDELYQRSASIMRRRRRPQRRRSTRRPCLLGRAIKRSVSRLKGGPTEFTSVIFPARRLNESFGSSSSCDARNVHRNRVLVNKLGRRKSSWRASKTATCRTTSEDSDTCRRLSKCAAAGANRSSSGYVSCSECSYDSESCTCVSADKCYCSLSRRVPAQEPPNNPVVCACDTDSCSESNKCYCARQPMRPTILEQLRQRGIVPSESTLSRAGSPDRSRSARTNKTNVIVRNSDVPKSRCSPPCASSDNLALDYDLFSPGRHSQQSSSSEKVLLVSARDTQGRLIYVGGPDRNKKCYSHGTQRSNGHHEALSIKKSAEIAAVFGANSNRICRRASNASSIKSSISLEAGLGYLP